MSCLLFVSSTSVFSATSSQQTDDDGDQYDAAYDQSPAHSRTDCYSDRYFPSCTSAATATLPLHLAHNM